MKSMQYVIIIVVKASRVVSQDELVPCRLKMIEVIGAKIHSPPSLQKQIIF